MQNRILDLDGVRNFRDFGGYDSQFGGRVTPGRLYRSGHMAEASDRDVEIVEGLGLVLQADLRRPDERERFVMRWTAPQLITSDLGRASEAPHQQFLKKVEASAETSHGWMRDYYREAPFKPQHVEMFSAWFKQLDGLERDAAGLVNCAAGKDRTGILCALTLHILGVDHETIRQDYELTNIAAKVDERLPEATDYFNNMLGKSYAPDIYRPFMGVDLSFLDAAFDAIQSHQGGVDAYLTETLDVSAQHMERLRSQLIMSV